MARKVVWKQKHLARLSLSSKRKNEGVSSSVLAKKGALENIKLQDIIEAARNEDTLVIELITQVGEKIGRGLGVLINLFNPELVILGGVLAQTRDYIRLLIKTALNKYSLSLVNNDSQLRLTKLGERDGVIGGCLMARSRIFAQ